MREHSVYSSFLSVNNRIEAETPQQREGRLLRDSQTHRNHYEVNPLLRLFDQPAVKLKIKRFHQHMASLQVEKFPELKIKLNSFECMG